MRLHDKESEMEFSRKAVWLLLAIALNALELFLPRLPFLPWLKPGLANCITVAWLIRYGTKDALLFTLLRSWISGFYFGFSFVTLTLSLSGGVLATVTMGLAWKFLGKNGYLGTIGLCIIGAVFHNSGQLVVVYLLLTHNSSVFYQLPFMGAASIFFGTVVGLIMPHIWNVLCNLKLPRVSANKSLQSKTPQTVHVILCSIIFLGCLSLFTINSSAILLATGISFTLFVSFLSRSWRVFKYPLRFWPLFLFILSMYLFFSYGTRVPMFPFLTYEGLANAGQQMIRIWVWLVAGILLTRYRFHETFFAILRIFFKNQKSTLIAGVLALEYFPELMSFIKSRASLSGLNFFRTPAAAVGEYLTRMQVFLSAKWESEV